jgi:hypothetical protein
MRESCSSGSVGGEGGNRLAYPAYTGRAANVVAKAARDSERSFAFTGRVHQLHTFSAR